MIDDLSDLARLRRIAMAAPAALGADGDWLAMLIVDHLASLPKIDIAARDEAIRRLGEEFQATTAAARIAAVRAALRRYATRWRSDRHRSDMPMGYAGTVDEWLFRAYRAGGGKVPLSERWLGEVLASRCFHKRTSGVKFASLMPKSRAKLASK